MLPPEEQHWQTLTLFTRSCNNKADMHGQQHCDIIVLLFLKVLSKLLLAAPIYLHRIMIVSVAFAVLM